MNLELTELDYVLIAVVVLSCLVGLLRGLLREAMSLVVWIAALWVAGHYDLAVARELAGIVDGNVLRLWLARALLLLGVLVAGGVVTWILGLLLQSARLTAMDRSVGLVFGAMRGVVLAGLLVIGIELVGLDREPWWRESKLVPYAAPVAEALRSAAEQGITASSPVSGNGQNAAAIVAQFAW
jgi:membrane protein required for colicin V production